MSADDFGHEQRRRPRFLCDDRFGACQLRLEGDSEWHDVELVNFNCYGVCLYLMTPITELNVFRLSFSFDADSKHYELSDIPAEVVYRNDSDIGSHCGIRFRLGESDEIMNTLRFIDHLMEQSENSEDRYGLLGVADDP